MLSSYHHIRIVWTRSREDWQTDQALFGEGDNSFLHLPCVTFHPAEGSKIPSHVDTAIITSSHALKFAAQNPSLIDLLQNVRCCFTIGKGTQRAANLLGLKAITPDFRGGGPQFISALIPELRSSSGILIIGPTAPAHDYRHLLKQHGIEGAYLALYETVKSVTFANGDPLTSSEIEKIGHQLTASICFSSPSAVSSFCQVFFPNASADFFQRCTAVAIGGLTHDACQRFFVRCQIAANHTRDSLLETAYQRYAETSRRT